MSHLDRHGIVIDIDGYKIDFYRLNNEGSLEGHELKEGEQIITQDWQVANGMNKPQWQFDTETWIDTDPLPPAEPIEPEPTPEDKINHLKEQVATLEIIDAGLLLENASQQVKIQDQEVTSANLLLEIAMLKGVM